MAAILTAYPFGGCNSPANHLATSGDVIGSASSQCKHVGRSGPLPSGRAIRTSGLPQRAQFKVLDIPPIASLWRVEPESPDIDGDLRD
jgi:hypothetical protein